jgi:hypothetical protein
MVPHPSVIVQIFFNTVRIGVLFPGGVLTGISVLISLKSTPDPYDLPVAEVLKNPWRGDNLLQLNFIAFRIIAVSMTECGKVC